MGMGICERVCNQEQAMTSQAKAQAEREGVEFESERGREIAREHRRTLMESMTQEERLELRRLSEWGPGAFTLLKTPDQGAQS